jgi:glycosyltransferase involved in cell wall biosynthesis
LIITWRSDLKQYRTTEIENVLVETRPLISVIVPCYNYGHLLFETLDNLRKQTYPDWECIVVDDGSTDTSSEVAKKMIQLDARFSYVYQKNAGLSAARNTGIRHSKGSFVQLLDADDFLESEKFKNQIAIFQQDPSLGIVYSEMRYFTSENLQLRRYTISGEDKPWISFVDSNTPNLLLEKLVYANLFVVNAPLIRKEVLNQIGDFNVALKSVEDWEYWCRCAFQNVKFKFDSKVDSMALVRTHSGSMSRSINRMMEASLIVRKSLPRLIENKGVDVKKLLEINKTKQAYLYKSLFESYRLDKSIYPAIKNLIQFGIIKKEFRFVVKELINLKN